MQVDNFINLGVFYLQNGDIEKSDAATRKALKLQPDEAYAVENAISSATNLDETAEAREHIAQAAASGFKRDFPASGPTSVLRRPG